MRRDTGISQIGSEIGGFTAADAYPLEGYGETCVVMKLARAGSCLRARAHDKVEEGSYHAIGANIANEAAQAIQAGSWNRFVWQQHTARGTEV